MICTQSVCHVHDLNEQSGRGEIVQLILKSRSHIHEVKLKKPQRNNVLATLTEAARIICYDRYQYPGAVYDIVGNRSEKY